MWPPWPTFRTCDLRPLGTTNCWSGCPKIFSRRYSTPWSIKKFPRPRSANFQHPRRVSSSLCSLISSALLIRLELVMSSFSPPLSCWWSETESGLTLGSTHWSSEQSLLLLIVTSPSSSSSSLLRSHLVNYVHLPRFLNSSGTRANWLALDGDNNFAAALPRTWSLILTEV